eukprot:437065_1
MADYLNDLMAANQELGDENNIFGTGNSAIDAMVKVQEKSGTNIVDYNRYANVAETQKVDYSKLTQISDKDVYNVVSVQETVIKDDGVAQVTTYKPNNDNLVVQETHTENNKQISVDSDAEAQQISQLKIIIEDNDTLTMKGISGNTTIKYLKSTIPKLNNCIFYDEDGYEISNMNTKIDAVADIDDNTFVLNAKIDQTKQYKMEQKEDIEINSSAGSAEVLVPKPEQPSNVNTYENAQSEEMKLNSSSQVDSKSEPVPAPKKSSGCCIIL